MGVKPKGETPSKLSFKKKLEIFETQASHFLTSGFVELLQQDTNGLNPQINFSAVGGGGGTELGSRICADQSDGGTQTGPRQGGGSDGWAGLGLVEMHSDTADRPTTGCGTQLGLEEGGGGSWKVRCIQHGPGI